MKRSLLTPLALGAALLALAACQRARPDLGGTESTTVTSAGSRPTAPPADFKSIAAKVVSRSADVRENEIVELAGDVRDLPLLEDMAIEVRKRGAHPIVVVGTEQFSRRLYDEVPAKYDSQDPLAARKLIETIDVFISTESGEGRTTRGVPPERQAARARAFQPLFHLAQQRGIRNIVLGNGLYPTEEKAEQFGLSRDALAGIMYGGIDTDYEQLQATGKRLSDALAGGKELRITSPNGTDLRIGVAGRAPHVSDGVISAEDRRRGGTALSVWLPAGEVYLVPVPGSAQGTLASDRFNYEGGEIGGLRLEIARGKVKAMTAKSGMAALQARYDAAGAGKDAVGVVDFGINPTLQVPEGRGVNVWSRAGAVTVAIGNNTWAGGKNDSDFGFAPEITRATVTLDGKPLVQDGKLVGAPAVAAR
jgi:leucyl aminopeptidase (aminopeptidase T)